MGGEVMRVNLPRGSGMATIGWWPVLALLTAAAAPPMISAGALLWLDAAAAKQALPSVGVDYGMALVWAVVLAGGIALWPIPLAHKRALVLLWLVRVGVVLGFMLFYESHYGLDATTYFHEGLATRDPLALLGPDNSGTDRIIGLVALHGQMLPYYHAMKLTWAAAGLLAVYAFYRAAVLYLGREDLRVLYLLGLFPSVLFWGSILGKDPITLLGIALYCWGVVGFICSRRLRYVVLAAIGIALAAWIRMWLGLIFLLPLVVFLMLGRTGMLSRVVAVVLVVPAFVLAMQSFGERFAIESAQDLVATTDQLSQGWAHGGSGQRLAGGFGSPGQMVAFIPLGVFTALFRPLPGEVLNPFGLMAGAENALLLALLMVILLRGRWRRLRDPILAWAALVVLVWAAIYGFISYQNLGSGFRFKAQIMPILLLLLVALASRRPVRQDSSVQVPAPGG
jgi:hypothetical protein